MNITTIGSLQNPLIVSDGLVGYWSLNDGSGTRVHDSSGLTVNDGILSGSGALTPTWVPGRVGPCLQFAGTTDYVDLNYNPSTLNAFTLACWYKRDARVVAADMIMSNSNAATTGGIFLFAETNGLIIEVGFYGPAGALTRKNAVITADPDWHHLVGTHVADSNQLTLYRDGASVGVMNGIAATAPAAGVNMYLGKHGSSNLYPFKGGIDDVRIYNRAITVAEAIQLYVARGT